MTENPLVSVVIPAHNSAATLPAALDSVFDQTYEPIECIVVDDGSSDETGNVARSFGSRVKLVSQEQQGVAKARNQGALTARGSLLAFLDSDDLWMPQKLSRQVQAMQLDPAVRYIYSAYWMVDRTGRLLRTVPIPRPQDAFRNALTLTEPGINVALTGLLDIATFWEVGAFDEDLSTSADLDLLLRIGLHHRMLGIEEPLAKYTRYPGQMSWDVALTERDTRAALAKFFSNPGLPEHLAALEPLCWTNYHLILAVSYLHEGMRANALSHLGAGFRASPAHFSRKVVQRLLERAARGSNRHGGIKDLD